MVVDLKTGAVRGAAMLGAAAGGHASLRDAVLQMAPPPRARFAPHAQHHAIYEPLYHAYRELHDHFGHGGTALMRRLSELRRRSRVS